MWGRAVGRLAGVNVPLQACEHFYVLTEPMADLPKDLPVLRDPDGCLYAKEDAGKLLVGVFEPVAKPWGMDGIPDDFEFGELPEDWDHFMPFLEDAMRRIPALARVGIRKFFCGPESFTPDDRYHLGEAPELQRLLRRRRLQLDRHPVGRRRRHGARRMDRPRPSADGPLGRRHPPHAAVPGHRRAISGIARSRAWACSTRCTGRSGSTRPRGRRASRRCTSASPRRAPALPRPPAGSGRAGSARRARSPRTTIPTAAPPGSSNWAAEHRAVRERAGLFDLSSFGKLLLQGRDAEAVLQRVCANDVAVAPGRVVYTQWLNERGGIEADLTVTRLADDRFMITTAAASQARDFHWLRRHIPDDAHAFLTDVTSGFAVLALMGPRQPRRCSRG